MVTVRRMADSELEQVAAFWAAYRDTLCRVRFGKTVEKMFGFGGGATTLIEESRIAIQNWLSHNGEAWICLDRTGKIRAASVYQIRPKAQAVTFFHLWKENPMLKGTGPPTDPFREALLQAILEDLAGRGYLILEHMGLTLNDGGKRYGPALLQKLLQRYDSLIKQDRYIVRVGIPEYLKHRASQPEIQALLKGAQSL